jgi:hypothetical protein
MSNTSETVTVKKEIRDRVAAEGKRIVDKVRYTDYRHRMEVDEFTGTYIMDCSGFVSYVLKRVAPLHFAKILEEVDEPRLRALEFYEYFSALKLKSDGRWRPIHGVLDIQRGDIIAWHPGSIEPHEDTGHVLIVAQTPVPVWRKSTHRSDDLETVFPDIYHVSVYDSSNIPHNHDTRQDGVTGVGMGEITFRADSNGRPTAFQFNVRDSFYGYPIAIGRPEVIEPEEREQRERDWVVAEQREKERLEAERREKETGRERERLDAERRETEAKERLKAEPRQKEEQERLKTEQRERAERRPRSNIHPGGRKTEKHP